MSDQILLFPFGGNSREAFDAIESINQSKKTWDILGFIDDNPELHGQEFCGIKVLGGSELLNQHPEAKVLAIPYFYKNFVASGLGLKMSLKKIYDENRLAIELIIASFILSITTTMTTGFGGTNHQAPFFTLYALVLAFLIANFNFKKYKRTPAYLFFLIIFILPNLYRFTREERVIMQKSYNHKSAAKLPEKIAQGLINAGLTKENPVLVLGAYPVVARLAGYKPFGGYLTDVYLFSPSKIYGEEHLKSLSEKINKVDIAYKLPDYPNLDWIKETNSNAVYLYIEEYVKNNFKAVEIIKEEYAPDQEVIIYKRIKLKR